MKRTSFINPLNKRLTIISKQKRETFIPKIESPYLISSQVGLQKENAKFGEFSKNIRSRSNLSLKKHSKTECKTPNDNKNLHFSRDSRKSGLFSTHSSQGQKQNLKQIPIPIIYQVQDSLQNILSALQQISFFKTNQNYYYCQKQKLLKLLSYIIMYTSDNKLVKMHKQYKFFNIINDKMEGVKQCVLNHSDETKKALNIHSNVYFIHEPLNYVEIIRQQKIRLENLLQQKLLLEGNIKQLMDQYNSLKEHYSWIEQEIVIYNQQKSYYDQELADKQKQCLQIRTQTLKLKDQYQKICGESKKVREFVQSQQTKKIMHLISKQYRQIQSSIYQYASYLQANQLATSYDYDPLHFYKTQQQINYQLKLLNEFIQGNEPNMEKKNQSIKSFIANSMSKYKRYGEQMKKQVDFKTNCINKFVDQMKRWLYNWDLKHEYLQNMRKEFTLDYQELMKYINEIDESCCIICHKETIKMKDRIVEYIQKIAQNYKMGNSFY